MQRKVAKEIDNDINAQVLRAIMLEYEYPYKCDIYARSGISDWAQETIGTQSVDWDYANGTYYFKQQKHLDFFILKWLAK